MENVKRNYTMSSLYFTADLPKCEVDGCARDVEVRCKGCKMFICYR